MSGKTSKSSTENGSVKKRGSTLQKVCLFGAILLEKAWSRPEKSKEVHVAKRGLREERETIIRFDETDEPVIIYTFNADLKRRLKDFARKYPDLCRKIVEDKEYGGMTYELEKSRLQIRFTAPYSKERRKTAEESVRKNRTSIGKDK